MKIKNLISFNKIKMTINHKFINHKTNNKFFNNKNLLILTRKHKILLWLTITLNKKFNIIFFKVQKWKVNFLIIRVKKILLALYIKQIIVILMWLIFFQTNKLNKKVNITKINNS